MKKQPYRRPWHFWCITLIALFFYAIGSYDFINVAIKNEYYLSKMYTPEGVAYFLGYPLPLLFLFGLNIAAGLSGILLALFHPKISWKLLLLSGTANTLLIFITVTFMDRLRIIGLTMTGTDMLVCAATLLWHFTIHTLKTPNELLKRACFHKKGKAILHDKRSCAVGNSSFSVICIYDVCVARYHR